jgi:hypothetical protein
VVEELPEGLEDEMAFLKKRLRQLGSINPNAPEELDEVQERHLPHRTGGGSEGCFDEAAAGRERSG